MKILFTGGGSGGHVYPLIAIVREMRRIYAPTEETAKSALEFYYLGPKDDFVRSMLSHEDFTTKAIFSGKIRRYFSFQNFTDILFKIPLGFLQALFLIIKIKPSLVFSKGGSGSISVAFAAKVLGVPLFLHESDSYPGLSNQKASKWAKKIFVSFPKTEYFDPKQVIVTGNPIRKEILDGDKKIAGDIFGLEFSKPIILIVGGSQGAEAINDFILESLNQLLKNYELIHVTGRENFDSVKAESQVVIEKDLEKYYHPLAFLDEEKTKHAYKASDLIISRSGSAAIFEIAAVGKPSILIPLPSSAQNHQAKNAYAYAESGAAEIIEQDNLTILNEDKMKQEQQSALAFAKPMAAAAIAREILEFLMLD